MAPGWDIYNCVQQVMELEVEELDDEKGGSRTRIIKN